MKKLWVKIRPYGRLLNAFIGFFYDFKRFYLYAGWRSSPEDTVRRNYNAVKTYHSLEKSMSFKVRKIKSGWANAFLLLEIIKTADKDENIGFHDRAALAVLRRFIELEGNADTENHRIIDAAIADMAFESTRDHGTKVQTRKEFRKGILNSPEDFFFSRCSLREFEQRIVSEDVIKRAVALAMKSPSVCNRQAWHVYQTDRAEVKRLALSCQSGNKGFGDRVPNLIIITSDLNAFIPGQEHYQHWIDGGLFSMSLIYALHSLGVASCCLNWCQSPAFDRLLRSRVEIRPSHTVIMMLAIGFPDQQNNVCVSASRPLTEVYSRLTSKKKT